MFGLSWDKIILILLAALFLLGPERIPVAVKWVMESLRKVRSMAAGAQEELRSQIGPELDELRRQIAELQSLKELGELRQLRELNPRTMITKNLLGEEFSGGVAGFLGLNGMGLNGIGLDGTGLNGTALNGAGLDGTGPGADTAGAANGTVGASNGAGAVSGTGAVAANGTGGAATVTVTPTARRSLDVGDRPPFDDEGT